VVFDDILCFYADNEALPTFACHMPLLQQLINISCPLGPQQQTCSIGFAADGSCWVSWDGQMDGQTDRQMDGHHTVS